jgi:hypothetical protein
MEGPGQVPPVLMLFTGLVCMGVMVNVTVVIPTASLVGSSLLDAALVISSYSFGACAGLGLFFTGDRQEKTRFGRAHEPIPARRSTGTSFIPAENWHRKH